MDWIVLGSWVANFFACAGAFESSLHYSKINALRMNILFSIANCYSVFYFIYTLQYPYILLQFLFLFLSIKGIIFNCKKEEKKEI